MDDTTRTQELGSGHSWTRSSSSSPRSPTWRWTAGGFDPSRLDGVLALFEGEARASWAAAEAEHEAVARATEAAAEAAEGHRGSSGEAGALAAATAAMEMAFNATSRS